MSSRYVTNAFIALLAGFVVVASVSFHASVVGWIGFAFGIGVVATTLLAQLDRARGTLQRCLDLGMLSLGGLAMAFGLAAAGGPQRWTVFAFALGWAALGFTGLTANEIASWRLRHGLGRLHGFPAVEHGVAARNIERPAA